MIVVFLDTAVAYLVPAAATYRVGPVLTDYDLTVQLRHATETTSYQLLACRIWSGRQWPQQGDSCRALICRNQCVSVLPIVWADSTGVLS